MLVILVSKGLLAVIDKNIPRPPLDADVATLPWQELSKEDAAWLLRNILEAMFEQAKCTKQRIVCADDVWSVIEEVNKDQGVFDHVHLVQKWMNIKITSIWNCSCCEYFDQYVDQLMSIINDSVEHRIKLDSYVIILFLLREAKRLHPREVDMVMQKLYFAYKRTTDYTMMDLQNIISEIRLGIKNKRY